MSAFGWVAMYWSAAFCTIGRTVVEPLIVIVCFWPLAAGTAVVTAAAGADTAAGVFAGATAAGVETVVPAGVTAAVFDPVSVQPANSIATTSNAARPMVMRKYELLCAFIVFDQPFNAGY
jgi:hypothetical protein